MECRNTFASRSNNSGVWNSSYCDDGGGSCSAGSSNSCGGDCDSGCFHRQRGEGLWRVVAAGWMQHPLSECRYVGWSRTN